MTELAAKSHQTVRNVLPQEQGNRELSEVDCVDAMDAMLGMYLNELRTKQKIVSEVRCTTPSSLLVTYSYIWETDPHVNLEFCKNIIQKLEMNIYMRNKGAV